MIETLSNLSYFQVYAVSLESISTYLDLNFCRQVTTYGHGCLRILVEDMGMRAMCTRTCI